MLGGLAEAACRTLLLAIVLQCALWLLRVRQARLLLLAWTVVLAASIAMPALLRLTPLQIPIGTALPAPLTDDAADTVQGPFLQTPPADAFTGLQAHPPSASRFPSASWLPTAYLVVACGLGLRVLFGLVLSLRLVARAVRIRPDWAAGSHVRVSRDVTGPVTVANIILMPIDVAAWPSGTRQAVLAHERAHVARGDFALLVVSQLHRAAYWFNPLSWWLHRRLVGLAELASDDQAIALTRDPIGYAEVLLQMGRRPGRVLRAPAMARPSTLHRRIDRILSGQATSCRVDRSRWMLLMTAVAALSLGIASLVPGEDPVPAAAPRAPSSDAASPAAPPPVAEGAGTGSGHPRVAGLPPPLSPNATAARQTPAATPSSAPSFLPLAHPAPRRSTTALRLPPAERRADPAAADPGAEREPAPRTPGAEEAAPRDAGASDVAGRQGPARAGIVMPPIYGSNRGFPSLPPPPESREVADNTCTGTVSIVSSAWQMPNLQSPNAHPSIVPGRTAPVRAQFFHKPDGMLWVRFDAFGRPALDTPVRFTRNGMTWVGEYGIAYTVRAAGKNRFAGLASPVARDSARIDLTCMKHVGSRF